MNRNLAIGYLLTVMVIAIAVGAMAVSVLIRHGTIPGLLGGNEMMIAPISLLALIPASVVIFNGTRRSTGPLRKLIGFSVSAADMLIGLAACASVALFVAEVTSGSAA
jgi:hypothetical protein